MAKTGTKAMIARLDGFTKRNWKNEPGDVTALERIEPIYEWFEGWKQPTGDARTLEALPRAARVYLDRIRELVDAPIVYVSVGTRRDQIIGLRETEAGNASAVVG